MALPDENFKALEESFFYNGVIKILKGRVDPRIDKLLDDWLD